MNIVTNLVPIKDVHDCAIPQSPGSPSSWHSISTLFPQENAPMPVGLTSGMMATGAG